MVMRMMMVMMIWLTVRFSNNDSWQSVLDEGKAERTKAQRMEKSKGSASDDDDNETMMRMIKSIAMMTIALRSWGL